MEMRMKNGMSQIRQVLSLTIKFINKMYTNIIGKKCLVRSYDAGVYFGTVTKVDGETVRVENVRNIWRWNGASCLSQIANDGIKDGRVSPVVSSMALNRCCQIIPCTDKAIANLENFSVWEF